MSELIIETLKEPDIISYPNPEYKKYIFDENVKISHEFIENYIYENYSNEETLKLIKILQDSLPD